MVFVTTAIERKKKTNTRVKTKFSFFQSHPSPNSARSNLGQATAPGGAGSSPSGQGAASVSGREHRSPGGPISRWADLQLGVHFPQ